MIRLPRQYDVAQAKKALENVGIKATQANIKKLIALTPDNRAPLGRLTQGELNNGAKALAEQVGRGGGGRAAAYEDIRLAMNHVPLSLKRYVFDVQDDREHFTVNPMRDADDIRPRAKNMRAGGAHAEGTHADPTPEGGYRINLEGEHGEVDPLRDGKWMKKSLSEMIRERFKGAEAREQLADLKAKGFDVMEKRDVLAVRGYGSEEPTYLAFRKKGEVNPNPEPFAPGRFPDATRGFVSICTEVTTEDFGGRAIITVKKPVLYFYPEKKTNLKIEVKLQGNFIAQYPESTDGTWNLVATPDGTLFDPKTEKRYSYLFWEGSNPRGFSIDNNQAFCVKSDQVESFLERAANKFGLNDKERTDFISFWVAPLRRNPVSLIQFLSNDEYERYAQLTVEPKPDTLIRMFMVFQRAPAVIATGNPNLPELRRGKFTVVEWGGANLDE